MVTIKETGLILTREKVRDKWIPNMRLHHGRLFQNNQKKLHSKAHKEKFSEKSLKFRTLIRKSIET